MVTRRITGYATCSGAQLAKIDTTRLDTALIIAPVDKFALSVTLSVSPTCDLTSGGGAAFRVTVRAPI